MRELRCCVIIPTYNNQGTIAQVIKDVSQFSSDIIVVNDGATDRTTDILRGTPGIDLVEYFPNKGKGIALRTGIKHAQDKGFRYAITIDSDGQHFADDIPVFIDKIEQEPDSLLIGARNLQQENMPKKNTFGNKFSNFWFMLFTGINLPDTQSGYRLYPISKMKGMRYFTSRYEFEIEVSVKAAWRQIPVMAVPIKVFYAEGEKRVSFFRPGKDFIRISLLNTYLFFPALLWHKPLRLIRSLSLRNFKALIQKHFLDSNESTMRKSVGVAFGVFMGIIPIWGFQFVSALVLAHFLKLNKAIVGLAAQISVPPMIPFLIYGSFKTGQWMMGTTGTNPDLPRELSFEVVKDWLHEYLFSEHVALHIKEYLLGSVVFAIMMGLLFGIVTFILLKLFGKKVLVNTKPVNQ